MTLSEANCSNIRTYLWENKHDLSLHPVSISIFSVLYGIIVILGVTGNLFVIISVSKFKSLQTVRNMFIVSLSVSDIVIAMVSGSVTPITAFTKIWIFGPHLCRLLPLLQGTSLCFSTLTLTSIAIDRYILIIYPTRKPIQKDHASRMILFNVSLALALSIPLFLKQELVEYKTFCGHFCTENWGDEAYLRSIYGTVVFIIQFIIPFIMITISYTSISLKLKKGILMRGSQKELVTDQRRSALNRRLRTNRMLMAMGAVFFFSWLPSVVFNFLRDYQWLPSFVMSQDYLFGIMTHCVSMSSTVWNPCLYALCNEHFRAAFGMLFQSVKRVIRHDKRVPSCSSQLLNTGFADQSTRRTLVAVPSSI